MRILALVTEAHGGFGGIAQYNRDLVTALAVYDAESEVIVVPRLMSGPIDSLPGNIRYTTKAANSKIKYIAAVIGAIREKRGFDLIVCAHINLLPLAFLARFWLHSPIVLVVYGIDAWHPTSNPVVNYLVGKIDAYISISDFTRKRFLGWTGLDRVQSFILPNAIALHRFGVGQKNINLINRYGLDGKRVLMTFGRLSTDERYKGIDEVLSLLPGLVKECPDIMYLIAGDGTDRKRLEEKSIQLGVSEYVVFAGRIPEDEKADHYRLADVYVMPSRGEGFGFVFLEAMACGVPVIASKVDGSREAVLQGRLGQLVDPDDPGDIKAAILQALKKPVGSIPVDLEYFDYPSFVQRVHRYIDQIVRHPHG